MGLHSESRSSSFSRLVREMLLNDRLISPMFVNKCKATYGKLPIQVSCKLVYSVGRLFHLDFGSQLCSLWIVGPTGAQVARLWYVMTSKSKNRYRTPYTGTSIHV